MIVLFILIGLLIVVDFILIFKKESTNKDDFLEELVDTRMELDKKRAILNLLVNKKVSVYDLSACDNAKEYNEAIAYGKCEEELLFYELEEDDFAFLKEHLLGQINGKDNPEKIIMNMPKEEE